jgi:hypothetical protein
MLADDDAAIGEGGDVSVEDRLRRARLGAQLDHLIEVAVVQPTIPADR